MKNKDCFLNSLRCELFDLHLKVDSLAKFLKSKVFKKLSDRNKDLLVIQYNFMLGYEHVLQMRIDENE